VLAAARQLKAQAESGPVRDRCRQAASWDSPRGQITVWRRHTDGVRCPCIAYAVQCDRQRRIIFASHHVRCRWLRNLPKAARDEVMSGDSAQHTQRPKARRRDSNALQAECSHSARAAVPMSSDSHQQGAAVSTQCPWAARPPGMLSAVHCVRLPANPPCIECLSKSAICVGTQSCTETLMLAPSCRLALMHRPLC